MLLSSVTGGLRHFVSRMFAENLDLFLFVSATALKARYVGKEAGLSTHIGNLSNLLFLLASVSLIFLLRSARWRARLLALGEVFVTVLLFSDVLHFRAFHEFVNAHELTYAFQMETVWSSVIPLVQWKDMIFVVDAPLWIVLLISSRLSIPTPRAPLMLRCGILAVCLGLYAINMIAFARSSEGNYCYETNRGESWLQVLRRGVLNYHAADLFFCAREGIWRDRASQSEITEARRWFHGLKEKGPAMVPFGVAKDRNLIHIQVESLQSFVIGLRYEGQLVTPNLTRMASEVFYFNRFFSQACQGATSDAEFCVMNSLLPPRQGAAAFRYQDNSFYALPAILCRKGYHTLAANMGGQGFWNAREIHRKYGFQEGYYGEALASPSENSWLVPDHKFFERVLPIIQDLPAPFFVHLITLTSHAPFMQVPLNRRDLKLGSLQGTLLGNYLQSMHYVDWAIGTFLDSLKGAGLYDRSVIVIYGDHEGAGMAPEVWATCGDYEGRIVDQAQRGRVPLLIAIPGVEGASAISDPSGQIDVAPTVLHVLGISDPEAWFLGRNLFREDPDALTYLRSGSFLTRTRMFIVRDSDFTTSLCRSAIDGAPLDGKECKSIFDDVQNRITISQRVLDNDLIPPQSMLLAK